MPLACQQKNFNCNAMANYMFFVGVDVSKETLDFCLRKPSGDFVHFQVPNSKTGFPQAMRALSKEPGFNPASCLLCMEYTGIYAFKPALWFKEAGFSVWVDAAAKIKLGAGTVHRGKDDKIDAYRICDYAFRFSDRYEPWSPPRLEVRQLAELRNAREQLKKAAHLIGVSSKESKDVLGTGGAGEKQLLDALQKIRKGIKEIERKIRQLIRSDENLAKLHKLICSIRGVADVTAVAIIIATDEFKKFETGRKLACHAGCAPFPHSSGTSIRGKTKVSHRANKYLKALLTQCARAAVRCNGDLKDYYLRKVAAGKHKNSVINAVRAKLILRIYACLRENREWAPSPPAFLKPD